MKKRILILLAALALILLCGMGSAERSVHQIEEMLKQACYIHPEGGTRVHTVPDCRSVHPQFLPLTQVAYTDEIKARYSYCPVCCLDESYGTNSQESEPAAASPDWPLDQQALEAATSEWEQRLGMVFNLWNWEQQADFQEQNGHCASYVFNSGIKRVRPTDEDISFAEAKQIAADMLLTKDSALIAELLDSGWVSSEYLDNVPYLMDELVTVIGAAAADTYGQSGIWHISWWYVSNPLDLNRNHCLATAYIDGKTGTVLEIRSFTKGYDEEDMIRILLP